MKIYIFGNGNLSFKEFQRVYVPVVERYLNQDEVYFLLCDFRGLDTLMMEYLKTETQRVSVYHIGEKARYLPDKYKTKVSGWEVLGGFEDDASRDQAAIEACTHFLALDINSNEKRKSGTFKNIELCESLGKTRLI